LDVGKREKKKKESVNRNGGVIGSMREYGGR